MTIMHINLTRTFVFKGLQYSRKWPYRPVLLCRIYIPIIVLFSPEFYCFDFFTGYAPSLERLKDDKILWKPCGFADRYYNIKYESMR